jgi:protein-L-isoaspartate(D-aspartate) O-methyltransferase
MKKKGMSLLLGSAVIGLLLSSSTLYGNESWTFAAFSTAMKKSGRAIDLDENSFNEIQQRRESYLKAIEQYLQTSLGYVDQSVVKVFSEIPREYFMYDYEKNKSFASLTYESSPHPWAIGYGSYLSNYLAQAYMTQIMKPKPGDVSLEIGTGSGFQSAILSRIVKEAYTIEIITALGEKVEKIFSPLGYPNIHTRVGDGYYGWPEVKDGFDIIMVTCAAPSVPPLLLEQLKKNGRMIIPIGQPYKKQFYYIFTKDQDGKVHSRKDMETYFIPMTGKVQE